MNQPKFQAENSQALDDWSKSQEALITELTQLRNEVASLKRSLPLSTQIIPSFSETIFDIGLAGLPKSYTVLLLEDSETDRATYRRFLSKNPESKCHIVEFNTAEESLVWCKDHTPDILLVDYLLPGMNGLEFLLQLQQQTGHERISCIVMTSQENQELAVQLLKSGVEDVLDKNRITSEGLNRAIANVLQRSFLLRQQEFQQQGRSLIEVIAVQSTDTSSELGEIFQYTVDQIRKLLQCDRVVLYQFQPDSSGKIITESVIDPTFSLLGKEFQDNCFTQAQEWKEQYRQGKITSIEDILANSHHSSCYQEFLEQLQVRAKLSVPILQEGQLWGLIIAHQCKNPKSWSKAEAELLKQIAIQINLAIQAVSLNQQAQKELKERQKIEKIINEISTILVAKIGEDFFQTLINYLSQMLGVDYVVLATKTSPEMPKTLVVSYQQQIIDNFEINITHQPCSEILKTEPNTVLFCQNNAQQLYPDHELIQSGNIQACLGIPLFNTSQEAIGLLTVLHRYPLENPQLAEEMLRIVASRAGAELERQQIEAKLRESEADLLEAQEIAQVGHWNWNKLANEVSWSPEIYRIFGVSPTQKITFSVFVNHIHPGDRDRVLKDVEATLQGEKYNNIHRICRADGNTRFIQSKGQAIFDAQHNVLGMKGVAQDITDLKKTQIELEALNIRLEERVKERTAELTSVYRRLQNELEERQQIELERQRSEEFYSEYLERELLERKRIEEALSESEIRYRRIVETSSEGIWQLDEDNKTVFVNPRIVEMLGYSVEEMMGKSFLEFLVETDRKAVKYLLEQLQNLIFQPYDVQFRHKDGSILWGMVSSRAIVNESGEYLGRLKMVTDISDRKKAENELWKSQQLLQTVLDSFPLAVFWKNRQSVFLGCNQLFSQISKLKSPPEAIGKTLFDFSYTEAEALSYFLDDQEVMESGIPKLGIQETTTLPSKEVRWVETNKVPLRDLNGEVIGVLGTYQDITDRKQAEEILKFQSQVLNEIHDAVITTDAQGIIQSWNHGAEELYEYTAEEMVGQSVSTLYFPEDFQKMQILVFDPLIKQERYQLELRNRRKSGREIYIRLRLSTIRDKDGNILAIVGCSNNISDRKKYEQDLLESTQFLETVLESFPLLVCWKDINLNYLGCNHNFAQSCGLLSPSAIRGRNDENILLTRREIQTNKIEDRRIIALGKPQLGIIKKRFRSDGSILWLETNKVPLRGFDGRIIGVLETSQDITSRKQNEGIVKEFNRRWRSVLDNIQMIVVELDHKGNVEYINPFFEKITQFTPEEVIGKNWFSCFIPSDLSSSIETVFQEVLKDNAYEYYVNPIVTKSGEKRIIAWRTCVLKDNTGKSIGVIAIGEDITEQFRLERMKSEFVSIVSHELKTPLTTLQASLSLLDGKFIDPNSEKGEEVISMATEGVDRLVRLVDDILDLERLRSGKLTITKTDCHTQNIIAGTISQTQELAKRADAKIQLPDQSFSCYADCDRLIQVLTNLITNAIKFSPYQSTIELSISEESDDPPYLLFSVRDPGRGIPAQNLQNIFERFQQVDASDSREKGGTGLGLSICRDIIEQHGGKIWAESVLKEGSTFFFTIPIHSKEVTNSDN